MSDSLEASESDPPSKSGLIHWSRRLRLLAVLGATRVLVARSEHEGWSGDELPDVIAELDQLIDAVLLPDEHALPELWSILYAPAGPLQDISIANGWSNAYLQLASEFDQLEEDVKRANSTDKEN